jgi:hypothetical protein
MRNVDKQIGLRELLKQVLLRHPRNNLLRCLDPFPLYTEQGQTFRALGVMVLG